MFRKLPIALVLVFLAACGSPRQSPVPQSAPQIEPQDSTISRAEARVIVDRFVKVVDTVGPVSEQLCLEAATTMRCDFLIAVDDRPGSPPNAFQTEDELGRPVIAFTLALIADVQNEDELAFVMAHEAAHHIRGHLSRQNQNASVGAAVFGQLAGVFGARSSDDIRAAQKFGAAVGARTYSKSYELEADALGARIALAAGYDPVRGSAFFTRIPDPGDRFLGTHPANAERIEVVKRAAGQS